MSAVTKKIAIKDMHCTSCALSIDMDLEEIEGVISSNTSYARMECEVVFDESKISLSAVIEQIDKTGYTVANG